MKNLPFHSLVWGSLRLTLLRTPWNFFYCKILDKFGPPPRPLHIFNLQNLDQWCIYGAFQGFWKLLRLVSSAAHNVKIARNSIHNSQDWMPVHPTIIGCGWSKCK